MSTATDALGRTITLERSPKRVVSLVPSITESVAALGKGQSLAAITKFCTHPPDLVTRLRKIGGTKNPDIDAIVALQPDLVLANREENRREDVEQLIDAGLPVFVAYPRTLAAAADDFLQLADLLHAAPAATRIAREMREEIDRQRTLNADRPRLRTFCPIWRNPYLAVGGDTFAADMLQLIGADNVFQRHPSRARYPQVTLDEIIAADPEVILLPDEPYQFRPRHRDELLACDGLTAAKNGHIFLVEGRQLTWHGPGMAGALRDLAQTLDAARPQWSSPDADEEPIDKQALSRIPTEPTQTKSARPEPPRNWQPARPAGTGLPPGLQLNVQQRDVVDEGD